MLLQDAIVASDGSDSDTTGTPTSPRSQTSPRSPRSPNSPIDCSEKATLFDAISPIQSPSKNIVYQQDDFEAEFKMLENVNTEELNPRKKNTVEEIIQTDPEPVTAPASPPIEPKQSEIAPKHGDVVAISPPIESKTEVEIEPKIEPTTVPVSPIESKQPDISQLEKELEAIKQELGPKEDPLSKLNLDMKYKLARKILIKEYKKSNQKNAKQIMTQNATTKRQEKNFSERREAVIRRIQHQQELQNRNISTPILKQDLLATKEELEHFKNTRALYEKELHLLDQLIHAEKMENEIIESNPPTVTVNLYAETAAENITKENSEKDSYAYKSKHRQKVLTELNQEREEITDRIREKIQERKGRTPDRRSSRPSSPAVRYISPPKTKATPTEQAPIIVKQLQSTIDRLHEERIDQEQLLDKYKEIVEEQQRAIQFLGRTKETEKSEPARARPNRVKLPEHVVAARQQQQVEEKKSTKSVPVKRPSSAGVRRENSTTDRPVNQWEKLYEKGKKEREETNAWLEQERERKEQEQVQMLQSKPVISELSKQLSEAQRQRLNDSQVTEYEQMLQRQHERRERNRNEYEQTKLQECTFVPRVNEKSAEMAANRLKKSQDNVHDHLYSDAKELNMRRESIKSQSDQFEQEEELNTSRRILSKQEEQAFITRMMHANKVKNLKLESMREMIFEKDVTFRPQTGRPPSRTRTGNSVSTQLYEDGKRAEEKKRLIEQARQLNEQEKQKTVFTNRNSERVLDEMKRRRVYAVFNLLLMEDSHCDGMIHLEDLEKIEESVAILPSLEDVLDIVIPLLKDYRDQNGYCSLNFSEFEQLLLDSEVDMDAITHHVRTVQNEIRMAQLVTNHSHHPNICAKSEKIDRRLKQAKSIESVIARCEGMMEFKRHSEEKKEFRRQLQIDNEMQYCTFEPKLVARKKSQAHYY
jgi:hypothetical protein